MFQSQPFIKLQVRQVDSQIITVMVNSNCNVITEFQIANHHTAKNGDRIPVTT